MENEPAPPSDDEGVPSAASPEPVAPSLEASPEPVAASSEPAAGPEPVLPEPVPVDPPPVVPTPMPPVPAWPAQFPTAYTGPVPPGVIMPGAGMPPPPGWPPPPKPKTFTAGLIAAIAVFVVVLLGCVGAGVVLVTRSSDGSSASADPLITFPTVEPSSSPGVDDNTAAGPQASPYPVKEIDDLGGVCEDTYYPQSPKYQGKAPHPIAIMVQDRKDMDTRIDQPVYEPGYNTSKARQNAWDTYTHPTSVQLVACVDLVSSGGKVKTCKFDDPKPDSLPLQVGNYTMTVYEASTRKLLFTKKITGDDRTCPTVVLIGNDRHLYTSITDRYYVELLKKYVEK